MRRRNPAPWRAQEDLFRERPIWRVIYALSRKGSWGAWVPTEAKVYNVQLRNLPGKLLDYARDAETSGAKEEADILCDIAEYFRKLLLKRVASVRVSLSGSGRIDTVRLDDAPKRLKEFASISYRTHEDREEAFNAASGIERQIYLLEKLVAQLEKRTL